MDKLKYFFWLCSGASIRHLKDCPADSSKYAGIGATVFFTSVFAALAAAYALFTVFDSLWTASFFGFLWGLMIFNLDRYIVSSMRKHKKPFKNLINIAPRLLLAILISIVIAKPLELKIFEKEINAELNVMQEEQRQLNESLLGKRFIGQKAVLQNEITSLKDEISKKQEKRDDLRRIAREEADGTGGTGVRNPGPIYKIKKAEADRVEEELLELSIKNNEIIDKKLGQITVLDNDLEIAKNEMLDANLTGLASRMAALDRIAQKDSAIWFANIFIMLLFILVECSPILVKLVTEKSSYDHVLELEEYKYETQSYKKRAKVNTTLRKSAVKMAKEEEDFIVNKLNAGLDKV